ncbi:hypothetical protein COO60DRAFT_132138 [Scenedesmus sp. NREL 46B-D3]|nr:hypothetical protein COO60DRAFT_132138 [Scenedesmus sp. NREL 46B-D3]
MCCRKLKIAVTHCTSPIRFPRRLVSPCSERCLSASINCAYTCTVTRANYLCFLMDQPPGHDGSTAQQLDFVHPAVLLLPEPLESEFWQSASAARLLKAFDLICLCNNIFTYSMLLRTFGFGSSSGMSWHHLLPVATYFILAILQLLVLLLAPHLHQRHRFRLTIINRLMRLATLTFAAVNSSPSVMARMTTRVNSASRSNTSQLMQLMRPIVGPPLVYLNHSGYVLPFAWVLPFQLYTLAACSFIIASSVCVLWQSEAYASMAEQACATLKAGMFYGSMLLGGSTATRLPPAAPAAEGSGSGNAGAGAGSAGSAVAPAGGQGGCQGAEAVLLLHVFAYVLLLVVLPLLVVYFVELSLKTNYLRQKQRQQQQEDAPRAQLAWQQHRQLSLLVDSAWVRLLVSFACVMGAFYACNAAVTLLSPLSCSGGGRLVSWQLHAAAAAFRGSSDTGSRRAASTEL